MGLANDHTFLN